MTLIQLRKRLDMSTRGHKLLKDKLDELLRIFLERVKENRRLREDVESRLRSCYSLMTLTYAQTGEESLDGILTSGDATELAHVTTENIISVRLPRIEIDDIAVPTIYSYALTPMVLDGAMHDFREVLPIIIELAELEKSIELLAVKIEATRRRVNALEHVLIPQTEQSIRKVRMSIEENERDDRTRTVKVKEMLSK
jgi:V/A-type H+-transporting ATPase subunit D